jgi:fucose permease
MTERVFRKRFLQLWLSFTIVGLLVARFLSITALRVESQKIVYLGIWLATVLVGVVLYFKGSVTNHLEREQILDDAHVKRPGWIVVSCSMFLVVIFQTSLALAIWTGRNAVSWTDLALLPVGLLVNLGFTAQVFVIVRNAHLRRMQGRST